MKIDSILLFETEYVSSLYPFTILHSAWELRCGAFRLFEKVKNHFPGAKIIYSGREKHLASFLARFDHDPQEPGKENILILNSQILTDSTFRHNIEKAYYDFVKENENQKSVIFAHKSQPVAAFVSGNDVINPIDFDRTFLPRLLNDYQSFLPKVEIPEPKMINFLWDAIEYNSGAILDDSRFFAHKPENSKLRSGGVHFVNENRIFIGKNCKIAPGVVIDAEEGPVIIGDNVKIMANSVILGPCFIGNNSIIKIGSKIYEHTSIGEWCKIGGEVENSIIHAYTNKQHDGFLGHSYISEWVNLGADTNTSDLKNTYGNIKVQIENEEFDTGRMFLGLLCGDHVKSAINTSFTTGTIAGICGIIVSEGFLPRYIPSFSWTGKKDSPVFLIDKALEIARKVMERRNRKLLPEEEILMKDEYYHIMKVDDIHNQINIEQISIPPLERG